MLKHLRKRDGLSQAELAKKIGIRTSTIGMYESGVRQPSFETEEKIADFFNVSLDFLRGKTSNSKFGECQATRIPVLGSVAAGIPIDAIEDVLDFILIPADLASGGDFFALRIKGDSMDPEIKDRDTVLVKKQSTAKSGDIVIASINRDTAVCKKFIRHLGGFILLSCNSKYEPIEFSDGSEDTYEIIGKVIRSYKDFK